MLKIIFIMLSMLTVWYLYVFIKDLYNNRGEIFKEPSSNILMAISQFIIFFFSSFGISDFAMGASLYSKTNWVEDKKYPGTLNVAYVLPAITMAFAYMKSTEVGTGTLVLAILSQTIGSLISPKYVVRLKSHIIKLYVCIGLFVAAGLILAGKFNLLPLGGEATYLSGTRLIILIVGCFIYGALNNIGIGSYSLTMATVYALGLNPISAFPIMMGAAAFSVPIGSIQFIKLGEYNRKISAFASIFGVLGVFFAIFLAKSLNVSMLQWIVVIVIIYSAITIFNSIDKSKFIKKIK